MLAGSLMGINLKQWKWVVSLLPIVIVGIGFFLAYRTIAKHRDLRETLLWMDQTYNPHEGGDNLGQGHGWEIHFVRKDGEEEVSEKFGMTITQDGSCNIVLHTETPAVGVFSEISSVTTYALSLCDVDPESIKIKTVDMHKDVFITPSTKLVTLFNGLRIGRGVRESSSSPIWAWPV